MSQPWNPKQIALSLAGVGLTVAILVWPHPRHTWVSALRESNAVHFLNDGPDGWPVPFTQIGEVLVSCAKQHAHQGPRSSPSKAEREAFTRCGHELGRLYFPTEYAR